MWLLLTLCHFSILERANINIKDNFKINIMTNVNINIIINVHINIRFINITENCMASSDLSSKSQPANNINLNLT